MQVEHLDVRLGGSRVLADINAIARRGEITALLGPNAAGKTTLLRTLAGLLRPDRGSVSLDGVDVHAMSSRVRAERISLVPQRFRSDVPFRVRAVVSMGAPNASRSRLDDVLQQLHLDTLADRIFATLSTGQQQRVVIARAMIQRKAPGVIVLDEPLASLDLRHAGGVLAMLRGRAESGDRIIMSMHDLSTASMVADAIWLLKEGQLVAAGLPDQVLTAPQLEAVFETGFEAVPGPGGVSVLVPVFGVGFGDGAGASSVVDSDAASG